MRSGAQRIVLDHRDHSYVRTFGSISPVHFPDELNTDAGLTMPDQNASNPLFTPPVVALRMGCTAYTTSELAGDQDKTIYNPQYTYEKTLFMSNLPDGSGCDIRVALKSSIVYGLERIDEQNEGGEALTHRRGQYFNVIDESGLDSFDDIRSAQVQSKNSVSIGLPWFPEYEGIGKDGIIPEIDYSKYTGKDWLGRIQVFANVPWHNAKGAGWVTRDGEPYLKVKSWQGKEYGDNGWCYFSRQTINEVMEFEGTGAYTVAQASGDNIGNIKSTFLEFLLSYLRNRVGLPI